MGGPQMKTKKQANHTPAPWTIERIRLEGIETFEIYGAEQNGSCFLVAETVGQSNPEIETNARLISEAPAMFALLKILRRKIGALSGDSDYDFEKDYLAMSNTIARIEGTK